MATQIGCIGLPSGLSREDYFKKLSFLETHVAASAMPSTKALRKWRTKFADQSISYLTPKGLWGDSGEDDWIELIKEHATALDPQVILLEPPLQMSPTQKNRDRLKRVANALKESGKLAWASGGLWEPETSIKLCEENELIWAFDPTATDPMREEFSFDDLPFGDVYLRIQPTTRRRLDIYDREQLMDLADSYQNCWIAMGGPNSFKNAQALLKNS